MHCTPYEHLGKQYSLHVLPKNPKYVPLGPHMEALEVVCSLFVSLKLLCVVAIMALEVLVLSVAFVVHKFLGPLTDLKPA